MLKQCSSCKEYKTTEHFHKCAVFPGGFAYKCKECHKVVARNWYLLNKEKAKRQNEAWKSANQDKVKEYKRRWFIRNRALAVARNRQYAKEHPEYGIASLAKRRAIKHKATVSWGNAFFIREAYHLARLRTELLGYKWHVDHIVPIKHKLVCGLHVEHNLRVIPASENWKKGNFSWPDMPN